MHHSDGLEDLLFFPSGTANASAFTEQSDPLKDSYGMTSPVGLLTLDNLCGLHPLPLKLTTRQSHIEELWLGQGTF